MNNLYSTLTTAQIDYLNSNCRTFNCKLYISTEENGTYQEVQCNVSTYCLRTGVVGTGSISIGNAISAQFEASIAGVNMASIFENKYMTAYLEFTAGDGSTASILIGKFKVISAEYLNGCCKIIAYDKMYYNCGQKVQIMANDRTIPEFITNYITSVIGISYSDVIFKLSDCGILNQTISESQMHLGYYEQEVDGVVIDSYFKSSERKFTVRTLIGYVASILGANAYFDRNSKLVFQQLGCGDSVNVGADRYMNFEPKKKFYTTMLSITKTGYIYKETNTTQICSEGSGNGVSIENPFITDALFNSIKNTVIGFNFYPATLDMFGDPRIEPGDLITVTDSEGISYIVPVFQLTQSYDGGCSTSVQASAETETSSSTGTISKATEDFNLGLSNVKEIVAQSVTSTYLIANYATIEELNASKARITSLESSKITTEYLNAHYAYIDFTNIADGTIKQAMIDTGAIGTVQIADGSITDAKIVELTANKINAGTLSVDRLIINGSNESIVFAINNMGELESTHYDSIDGGVLTERSITADRIVANAITSDELASNSVTANKILAGAVTASKINVSDLSALNATIGGWTINPNYLYCDSTSGSVGLAPFRDNQYVIWAGETNGVHGWSTTDAKFKVAANGKMYATDATLTGTISSRSDEQKLSSTLGSGYLLLTNDSGHAINARANGISLSDPTFASNGSMISASGAVFNSRASTSDTFHTSQYMGYEARIGGPVYAAGHVFSGGIWCVRALNNSVDYISDEGSYLHIVRNGKDAVGITYNVSDPKFKDNIAQTQVNGSNLVRQIGLYQFDWNAFEPGKHEEIGFNARELAEIKKDFALVVKQDDGSEIYQVDERRLLPVYAKCLQEILDRLDNIEGRIGIIEQNM